MKNGKSSEVVTDQLLVDVELNASHVRVSEKGMPWVGGNEIEFITVLPDDADMSPEMGFVSADT